MSVTPGSGTPFIAGATHSFGCGTGFPPNYGAERDRTADLLNAIQALSQLSYSPQTPKLSKTSQTNGTDGTRTHGLRSDSAAL